MTNTMKGTLRLASAALRERSSSPSLLKSLNAPAWQVWKLQVSRLAAAGTLSLLALTNLSAADSALSNEVSAEQLGERGALERIEFEGVHTFNIEDIRNALAQSAGFLLASHPEAPPGPYLEILRQKVLAGYQQNGFPNARVSAEFNPATEGVRVRVTEGARYRCGKVQVIGIKGEPARVIVARLSKPVLLPSKTSEMAQSAANKAASGDNSNEDSSVRFQTEAHLKIQPQDPRSSLAATRQISNEQPLWIQGEPAAFGEAATRQIDDTVKDCLAELGFFFPQVASSVKLNSLKQTAELLVHVLDEGPRGTISTIEVTGNQKNTPEEILKFLRLKRGMAITRSRIAEAEEKLWRSARFLHYEIRPSPPTPGLAKATGVRLLINLREYAPAPKLTEPFTFEQQALVRLCDWISSFETRAEELSIRGGFTGEEDPFRLRANIIVSPHDGALLELQEPSSPGTTDYAILFARKTVGLYSPNGGYKLFVNEPDLVSEVTISYMPNAQDTEHPFNLTLAAGWRHVPGNELRLGTTLPFRLDLKLAPVAFLHFLELSNVVCRVKGNSLSLVSSNHVLRFDAATGRLDELSIHYNQMWLEIQLAKGSFGPARQLLDGSAAALSNRYAPEHPFSSMMGFVAVEMARWRVFDKMATNLPALQRQQAIAALNKLLSATVLAPIDQLITKEPAEPFTIPAGEMERALAQNSLSTLFAAFGFRYCNALFPKYSWPWTIARESVFVLANQSTYTDSELKRLYQSEETGPIGCLVIAELLSKMNSPAAKTFAILGLTRLSPADFRNDCRLFLQDASGLARAFSNMASVLREMPNEEIDALAAVLPDNESTLLRNCAQKLRSAPSAPLDTSLRSALDTYWEKCLRSQVRGALQKLSTVPAGGRSPNSSSTGA